MNSKSLHHKNSSLLARIEKLEKAKQSSVRRSISLEEELYEILQNYNRDLENSRKDIEVAIQENQDLKRIIASSDETALAEQLNLAQTENSELKSQVQSLQEQNSQATAQLDQQNSDNTQLQKSLQEAENQLEFTASHCKSLEQSKQQLLSELNNCKSQLTRTANSLKQKDSQLANLTKAATTRENAFKLTQREFFLSVKKAKELEKQNSELREQTHKLQEEVTSKHTRLLSLRTCRAQQDSRIKNLLSEKEELKELLRSLQNRLESAELAEIQEKEVKLVLGLELVDSESKIQALYRKVNPLLSKNIELQNLVKGYSLANSELPSMHSHLFSDLSNCHLDILSISIENNKC